MYASVGTTVMKKVPVVELSGTGYERGVEHGTKLKNEIAEVMRKFKINIRENTKKDPDTVIADFLGSTNFKPAIEKHTPGLMEEINAEGSGQKVNDVFAFQLVDEFWVYLDRLENVTNHHCSAIAVAATADRPAYVAQNMDIETYTHGYQVLFHLAGTDREPEQYVLSSAGLIALTGMNRNGIGVCVNTLMELKASSDELPVACVIRGLLSKSSAEDALEFLQNVKHASGQNYVLGLEDKVYDFEASANQVIRYSPTEDGRIVYHTNHAMVNHDVKPWQEEFHRKMLAGETKGYNSETRLLSLTSRLNLQATGISEEVIKSMLKSKDNEKYPVCRAYRQGSSIFTFSSVLFALGGKRSVQVTYGSPDQSDTSNTSLIDRNSAVLYFTKQPMNAATDEFTQLLVDWRNGNQSAIDKLMPMVYSELRRLAHKYMRRERPDHTWQTTDLVHEAYIRLAGKEDAAPENRVHFFGMAAQLMRRLLVEHARSSRSAKRGGGVRHVSIDDTAIVSEERTSEFLALDEALGRLARLDPRKTRIVEMRYFAGLNVDETAEVLGLSPITIKREWLNAKAWLYRELNPEKCGRPK